MYSYKALLFLSIVCTGCQSDIFRFSSEREEDPSHQSYKPKEWLAYCNNFNEKGFKGILTAYFDAEINDFNTNKAWLHLSQVPKEFEYPKSNYIQIHPFNVDNNRVQYNSSAVDMEIIKDSNKEKMHIVSSIEHKLLKDMGYLNSVNDLIHNYGFILHDLSGWEGLSFSVFNSKNAPISTTSIRVLVPPFLSNPHTYSQRHNNERLLLQLHPFEKITTSQVQTEDVFYNKARDICNYSPIPVDIPSFTEQVQSKEQAAEEELFNKLWNGISDLTNNED